jgi:hypothetical protein
MAVGSEVCVGTATLGGGPAVSDPSGVLPLRLVEMIIVAAEAKRHSMVRTTLTASNGEPRLLRRLGGRSRSLAGWTGTAAAGLAFDGSSYLSSSCSSSGHTPPAASGASSDGLVASST